ncbi:MAG: methionine synthase [Bacteroidetes bacterium]|nr:methionine synthase [Bacteroidota bacterium]
MIASMNVQTYNLLMSDLGITVKRILCGMGYDDDVAPEYIITATAEFLKLADKNADLKVGFAEYSAEQIQLTSSTVSISGYTFNVEKIIANHLKGAESIIVFAASAGEKFDKWIASQFNANEQLYGYIADTIGSEIVESACDWLENFLVAKFEGIDWKCSNRLSPGYCNWNVEEQHKIFALLPDNFCGIKLNESALMKPIKSISGIIAAGREVRKLDYQCNICNLENCYKRRKDKNLE